MLYADIFHLYLQAEKGTVLVVVWPRSRVNWLLTYVAARGEKFDGTFNAWDSSYYQRILLENEYSVDQEQIKQFFSLETTIQSKEPVGFNTRTAIKWFV